MGVQTLADAYRLIHAGILAFSRAERQGIRVDVPYCRRARRRLSKQIERLEGEFRASDLYRRWEQVYRGKTNILSNQQLARVLYGVMGFAPSKTTKTGQGATDEEALLRLGVDELRILLQIRKLTKVRDTYLEAFIREQHGGWIHPFFNLHTVRTYRSSSDSPNLQNVPKRDAEAMKICRRALLPRPGHQFIEIDFAALEVHIAACYCKDPTLIAYLEDPRSDMHADMAKQLFMLDTLDRAFPAHHTLRQAAKNGFVFPQFYGDYYGNNAVTLAEWVKLSTNRWRGGQGIELPDGTHISDHFQAHGIKGFQDFVEHVRQVEDDFWGNRFRTYREWRERWVAQYRRAGYLRMFTGFICSGELARNEIINYPIQGTAFHCLLQTFILLDDAIQRLDLQSRLVGQIHDSVLIDAHPSEVSWIEQEVKRIIREDLPAKWDWIVVPLEVDMDEYAVDGPWVKGE
jgi:DNA polymerase I-like protein with 3'-5' exonuclease and polymerase domains